MSQFSLNLRQKDEVILFDAPQQLTLGRSCPAHLPAISALSSGHFFSEDPLLARCIFCFLLTRRSSTRTRSRDSPGLTPAYARSLHVSRRVSCGEGDCMTLFLLSPASPFRYDCSRASPWRLARLLLFQLLPLTAVSVWVSSWWCNLFSTCVST